tara:strand:- start:37 stop:960 length:924 start_codon:yes stop_codon:yes gene_type:complete
MFEPIKEIVLVIIKRKEFFSKILLLFLSLSLLFTLFFRVPYYTSTAKIFINSKTSAINQTSFLGGILGSQTGGARDVQILTEIIKGNSFFEKLLNNQSIIDSKNRSTLKTVFENKLDTDNVQKLHQHFLEILNLTYDSKRQIINVGIKSNNREIAKNSTSLILVQVEKSYVDYKNNLESNKILSLDKRIDEINDKLEIVENKLTNFRENNISFQSSPSLLVQYEGIVRDRLILEQTLITLNAQKELSEVELKSNADLFLILNEPYLPPYKNPPSNKTLFLMLSVVSFILSVTITLIIDEKSKKEIQL